MKYAIKRGAVTVAEVRPETANQTLKIMGENVVQMTFSLPVSAVFQIGDTVTVFGQEYKINTEPKEIKADGRYQYALNFEAVSYDLAKVQLKFPDSDNNLTVSDFFLMGNAETVIDLILQNVNAEYPGFVKGTIDETPYKNLSFSGENCLSALARIAEEFETEFHFTGKTIDVFKKSQASGLVLEYGPGKGLYELHRKASDNRNIITRLYAFGSKRNIPGNYRNFSDRLKMPVAQGVYIEQNTAQYGVIEATKIFDEVYPHRIGTISAVDVDSPFKFTDAAIDFNVNDQLLPGVSAKIVFNTGDLAGYEFEVSSFNNATKEFVILVNKDEKAIEVPSVTLRPKIGDKYIVIDIKMPQSYIDLAEAELQTKAADFLAANSVPRTLYELVCDPLFFAQNAVEIALGLKVQVNDADLGVNQAIRVIGYSRDLINTSKYNSIELAESVSPAAITRIVGNQEKSERVINLNDLTNVMRARRNWRTSQELLNMVYDPEGNLYTDKIKPGAISTQMLEVGTRSQQFNLNGIVFKPNKAGNPALFASSAGTLDHFTIDDAGIRTWNIDASDISGLADGNAYYVYAKCSKTTSAATILVTTSQLLVAEDAAYYHFLIGVLHSVIDGVRGVSLTYGQTEINGKFIKTGVIYSSDGLTYFNLDIGEIGGTIKFKTLDGSLKNVQVVDATATNAQTTANNAQATANEAKGVTDNFTVISGGLIQSNTIKLGSLAQDVAGITGVGSLGTSVRFWAGSTFDNRDTAPFRVDQSGRLFATNAVISGDITATSGTIAGVTISANDQFSLNGTKVTIIPNAGISSTGYMRIPLQAPTAPAGGDIWLSDGATAGTPAGGSSSLSGMTDVALSGLASDQLLKWNSVTGKWENWTPNFTTDLSNYWNKGEADARFVLASSVNVNAIANSIPQRDANGYLKAVFFHESNTTVSTASGFITALYAGTGDGYLYKFSAGAVNSFLGINTGATLTNSITGNADNLYTPSGTYKHVGAWGVGRTDPGAILVNTAYLADYATNAGNATTWNGQAYTHANTVGSYFMVQDGGGWKYSTIANVQTSLGITGGPFLPLTGGTLSSWLQVNSYLATTGHVHSGGYVYLGGSTTYYINDAVSNLNALNLIGALTTAYAKGGYFNLFVAGGSRGGLYTYNSVTGSGTNYGAALFSETDLYFFTNGSPTVRGTLNASGLTTAGNQNKIGNVNLGWSGGGYSMIGYNIRFTGASNSYQYDFADTSWALDLGNSNYFRVKYASGGAAGTTISYTDLLFVSPAGHLTTSGNAYTQSLIATYDITSSNGQGRFGGWYTGSGFTGAAVEVGFTGGMGYVIGYNRITSSYQPINIDGSTVGIAGNGGLTTFGGGITGSVSGSSYGSIKVDGQTGNYSGIYLSYANMVTGMHDSDGNGGSWHPATGWYWYFNRSLGCLGLGGSNTTSGYAAQVNGALKATGLIYSAGYIKTADNFYVSNYGHGLIGVYDSTRYQAVFAMGDAYKISADGTNPANVYGIVWTHSNVGGQSIAGLGHQALFMANGGTMTAIGDGIWTRSNITAIGTIRATAGMIIPTSAPASPEAGSIWIA